MTGSHPKSFDLPLWPGHDRANADRHIHTYTEHLQLPVHLKGLCWAVRGNQRTWRKPVRTHGEHANSAFAAFRQPVYL